MKCGYYGWKMGISTLVSAFIFLASAAHAKTAVVTITVSPAEITLAPKGNVLFQARIKDGKKIIQDAPITWKAQGGTITTAGMYTAPVVAGQYQVTATTTGAVSDTSTVTVDPNIIPPYRLTFPNNGETFRVSDTVNIKWVSDLNQINDAGLSATVVGENNFVPIWPLSIIPEHDHWEDINWVVPAEIDGIPLAGKQLIIQVGEYYGGWFDNSDIPVKIVAADAGIKRKFRDNLLGFPTQNKITVNSSNPYRISISSLSGREQYQYRNSSPHTLLLRQTGLAEGVYVVQLEASGTVITKILPYLKAD